MSRQCTSGTLWLLVCLLPTPEEIILNILEDADYQADLACKRVRSVRLLLYILLNRTGGYTCRRVCNILSRSIRPRYLPELVANVTQRGSRSSLGRMQCLEILSVCCRWTGNAIVGIRKSSSGDHGVGLVLLSRRVVARVAVSGPGIVEGVQMNV